MRTLIHLLIMALALTASTSTIARTLDANSHQAAASAAQKLASGPSGSAALADTWQGGSQRPDFHQETGRSGSATASGFVVLVHNTCAIGDTDFLIQAFRGGTQALDAIAAHEVRVTGATLREFLFTKGGARVSTFAQRREFLHAAGIKLLRKRDVMDLMTSPQYSEAFGLITRAGHSVFDAHGVGLARASGRLFITGEGRVPRLIANTFSRQLGDVKTLRTIY